MPKLGQIGEYWLSKNRHGTWCRTWFDKRTRQTRRIGLGAPDYESAMIALANWYVLNTQLSKEQPSDVPLHTCLDRYREARKDVRTADSIGRHVRWIKETFGAEIVIADLTLDAQNELEKDLRAKGYKDGYLKRIQTTLKAAVSLSYENGEITSAPFIRVVSSNVTRKRLLSLKEAAALLNGDVPEYLTVYLVLAFNTLARPEALFDLQPFQVDFEHRLLDLNPPGRTQTKKYRPIIPITDTLLPWLQVARSRRYLVQWRDEQVKPITTIKIPWRALRKATGLSADVVPYTIRHTMATELRRRGVPEWEVEGFMGHRRPSMSERYAQFVPDYLGKCVAAIDDYMHELQPLVKREIILPKRLHAVK